MQMVTTIIEWEANMEGADRLKVYFVPTTSPDYGQIFARFGLIFESPYNVLGLPLSGSPARTLMGEKKGQLVQVGMALVQ